MRRDPVGLYFGTTTGEVWGSTDEGATLERVWRAHLPHDLHRRGGEVCVMRVLIPSPLRSYTGQRRRRGGRRARRSAELLADLDRQFPGIRFRMIDEQDRMRQHIRIFVNGEQVRDLSHPVAARDEVQVICALSGG